MYDPYCCEYVTIYNFSSIQFPMISDFSKAYYSVIFPLQFRDYTLILAMVGSFAATNLFPFKQYFFEITLKSNPLTNPAND